MVKVRCIDVRESNLPTKWFTIDSPKGAQNGEVLIEFELLDQKDFKELYDAVIGICFLNYILEQKLAVVQELIEKKSKDINGHYGMDLPTPLHCVCVD